MLSKQNLSLVLEFSGPLKQTTLTNSKSSLTGSESTRTDEDFSMQLLKLKLSNGSLAWSNRIYRNYLVHEYFQRTKFETTILVNIL